MLHSCAASLSKQEGYGVAKVSNPAVVLGTIQPVIVPHHIGCKIQASNFILWQHPLTFYAEESEANAHAWA